VLQADLISRFYCASSLPLQSGKDAGLHLIVRFYKPVVAISSQNICALRICNRNWNQILKSPAIHGL
jgi:hypothetical protein